jgi:hypothetical protein
VIRRVRVFGVTVLEVETSDAPSGAPDFTSGSQPAGFVRGDLPVFHRPDLEPDDGRDTPA